jgi:hypothetical protein
MDKLFKILRWVATVLVLLLLIGLGLRIARAFFGLAVLVGIAVLLWVLFGPSAKGKGRPGPA